MKTTVSDIPKKRIHEEKKVQPNRVMQIERFAKHYCTITAIKRREMVLTTNNCPWINKCNSAGKVLGRENNKWIFTMQSDSEIESQYCWVCWRNELFGYTDEVLFL